MTPRRAATTLGWRWRPHLHAAAACAHASRRDHHQVGQHRGRRPARHQPSVCFLRRDDDDQRHPIVGPGSAYNDSDFNGGDTGPLPSLRDTTGHEINFPSGTPALMVANASAGGALPTMASPEWRTWSAPSRRHRVHRCPARGRTAPSLPAHSAAQRRRRSCQDADKYLVEPSGTEQQLSPARCRTTGGLSCARALR